MGTLREDVLRHLLDRPGGATLSEIASALRRDAPPVLHHLQALVNEGLVERDESEARPRYRPLPFFSATWIVPEAASIARWSISERISWRFPLTSRILDKRARDTVLGFLRLADEEGHFTRPDLLTPAAKGGRSRTAGMKKVDAPGRSFGLRFVVFGSVARGDAGPSSDVDLLVLVGPALDALDVRDGLEDVAATVNLHSPRRLHLATTGRGLPLNPRLAEELRREGILVYSSYDGGEYEPLLDKVPT